MKQQLIDFFEFKFQLYRYNFLKNLFHKIRVKEFMSKDEKKLFDIELKPNSIIFDVGGYEGNFTERLLEKNPKSFFYIFEPIYQFYKNIKKKFENGNNIYVFPVGLSDEDKNIPLEVNFDRTTHSGEFNLDGQFELSNLKSISNFIIEKKIEHIDLLKLNVEGAEYEILNNLISKNLIGKVNTLLIQFHLNESVDYKRYKTLKKKILKTHKSEFNSIFVWEKFTLKTF